MSTRRKQAADGAEARCLTGTDTIRTVAADATRATLCSDPLGYRLEITSQMEIAGCDYEPLVAEVARRRGMFAAFGVDVVTSTVPSSYAQRDALDAGRTDVAVVGVHVDRFAVATPQPSGVAVLVS